MAKKTNNSKKTITKKSKSLLYRSDSIDIGLWKEIILGVIEAIVWCTVIFLLVYNYSDEIIEMVQFMADNVDKVFTLYLILLPIFIIIAITIKIGIYTIKSQKKK